MVVFTDGGVRPRRKQAAAAWIILAIHQGPPCKGMAGAAMIPFHGEVSSYVAETIAIGSAVAVVNELRHKEVNQAQLWKQRVTYTAAKREEAVGEAEHFTNKMRGVSTGKATTGTASSYGVGLRYVQLIGGVIFCSGSSLAALQYCIIS